jgi:hypothetical protein
MPVLAQESTSSEGPLPLEWQPKQGDAYDFKKHPFPPEPAAVPQPGPPTQLPKVAPGPVIKGMHNQHQSWLYPFVLNAEAVTLYPAIYPTCYKTNRADGSYYVQCYAYPVWGGVTYPYNSYETTYAGNANVYGSDNSGNAWTWTVSGGTIYVSTHQCLSGPSNGDICHIP